MKNTFVLYILFLFHFPICRTYETYCSSGERLHTPREGHDVCIPCHHGTFMAEEHHFSRQCNPCTEIENSNVEVLVSACNLSHDAVILCINGFYRRRTWNIRQKYRCEKCTECPFPAPPCQGYYDTYCCPPNQDAVMTPDGVFVCNERPIACGAGQFFRTSSEECLPCPAGTFMSDQSHRYKDCLKCEELSENNLTQAVITRQCNRTAPTLFGCKAGYFRDPTQESLQIEVPCTPCRICNRSLVTCGMFHDVVCDYESRMISTVPTNLTVSIGDVIAMKQLHGAIYAHNNTPQFNKTDCELPNSSERSVTICYWISQLIFVTLLMGSILTLTSVVFPQEQSNLTADHTYDNTFHLCCRIEGHVHKIRWFTIISLFVFCIFQSVATLSYTKPGLAYALTAVYTLMTLSLLIVIGNAIAFIVCFYINYKLRDFQRMQVERWELLP